jgi:hypothetical protein
MFFVCLFFVVLAFELRASCLLDSLEPLPPPHFCFSHFSHRILHFCPGPALSYNPPTYLCLLACLESQACTTVPSFWLRWSLADFLPLLTMNHNSPTLCFPSNWDYRHVSPLLSPKLGLYTKRLEVCTLKRLIVFTPVRFASYLNDLYTFLQSICGKHLFSKCLYAVWRKEKLENC